MGWWPRERRRAKKQRTPENALHVFYAFLFCILFPLLLLFSLSPAFFPSVVVVCLMFFWCPSFACFVCFRCRSPTYAYASWFSLRAPFALGFIVFAPGDRVPGGAVLFQGRRATSSKIGRLLHSFLTTTAISQHNHAQNKQTCIEDKTYTTHYEIYTHAIHVYTAWLSLSYDII